MGCSVQKHVTMATLTGSHSCLSPSGTFDSRRSVKLEHACMSLLELTSLIRNSPFSLLQPQTHCSNPTFGGTNESKPAAVWPKEGKSLLSLAPTFSPYSLCLCLLIVRHSSYPAHKLTLTLTLSQTNHAQCVLTQAQANSTLLFLPTQLQVVPVSSILLVQKCFWRT